MKEHGKCKKRAITDLNAPNCSRDIPFQSEEFGQDGHRHFVGFQPHFLTALRAQPKNRTRHLRPPTRLRQTLDSDQPEE